MLKIENAEVYGWEVAIRTVHSSTNSLNKSDSRYCRVGGVHAIIDNKFVHQDPDEHMFCIDMNDWNLMTRPDSTDIDHRKFIRMITVTLDITAPLYWWSEFDTCVVDMIAQSYSLTHQIQAKEFTLNDFSTEHLLENVVQYNGYVPTAVLTCVIGTLNEFRKLYLESKNKVYWWQMIQLLPSSYNQYRTVQLNYAVLRDIYSVRRNYKLDEWRTFCDWVKKLPHGALITGEKPVIENNSNVDSNIFNK